MESLNLILSGNGRIEVGILPPCAGEGVEIMETHPLIRQAKPFGERCDCRLVETLPHSMF